MRIFRVAFALLAAMSASGCATSFLNSDVGNTTYTVGNEIEDVTAAYRDAAGNVTVCVKGALVGTNENPSASNIEYSIRFPAASAPKLEASNFRSAMRYRTTPEDIQRNCPVPEAGMAALPVYTMRDGRRVSRDKGEKPDSRKFNSFSENRIKWPAIYRHVYRPPGEIIEITAIVYMHDSPAFENKWAVEIDANLRQSTPNIFYYLLLPFAVTFDFVTFPVQFVVFMVALSQVR